VWLCDCFFFQAEDGIRDWSVTGVQTCALPISFSAMPTPPAPSSDAWNHGGLTVHFGLPPGRGILVQLTQLIDPPTSQTRWNSPRSEERRVGKECRARWAQNQ